MSAVSLRAPSDLHVRPMNHAPAAPEGPGPSGAELSVAFRRPARRVQPFGPIALDALRRRMRALAGFPLAMRRPDNHSGRSSWTAAVRYSSGGTSASASCGRAAAPALGRYGRVGPGNFTPSLSVG
jgi:hypothetical protein